MLILLEKMKKAYWEKNFRSHILKYTNILKRIIHNLISISILFFKFLLYSILSISIFWIWHKTFPIMFKEFSQYMRLFEGIACNIPIASDCFTDIISTAEEAVKSGLREIQNHHDEYCCKLPHRLGALLQYVNIKTMLEVIPDHVRGWEDFCCSHSKADIQRLNWRIGKQIFIFSLVKDMLIDAIDWLQLRYIPSILNEIKTASSYQHLNSPIINLALDMLRIYLLDAENLVSLLQSWLFQVDTIIFRLQVGEAVCTRVIETYPANFDPNFSSTSQLYISSLTKILAGYFALTLGPTAITSLLYLLLSPFLP